MTIREFIEKNKDILLEEIEPAELLKLPQGEPVFYISANSGNKSKYNRQVTAASFGLNVHAPIFNGLPEAVDIMRLTHTGTVVVNIVHPVDLTETGNRVLFRYKPIDNTDPRFNKLWKEWPI